MGNNILIINRNFLVISEFFWCCADIREIYLQFLENKWHIFKFFNRFLVELCSVEFECFKRFTEFLILDLAFEHIEHEILKL